MCQRTPAGRRIARSKNYFIVLNATFIRNVQVNFPNLKTESTINKIQQAALLCICWILFIVDIADARNHEPETQN
jgi:hypothetical protein